MKKLLLLSLSILLISCANQTPAQQNLSTQAISDVENAAIDYATGNTGGSIVAGIQGATLFLRSLQATPNAANYNAVATAVTTGSTADTPALTALGQTTANAVQTLVQQGSSPDAANEAVATALDQAVVQINTNK